MEKEDRSESPKVEAIVTKAQAVPGLVEGLKAGNTDALRAFFELEDGIHITSVTTRKTTA